MKVTQLQLVWEYLNPRGTMTAHDIAHGMNKDLSSITSELFKLCQQGQAYREKASYINENAHKVTCYKYTAKGTKYVHGRTLAALQRKAKKEMAELAHAKSKQMELPLATLPAPVTEQKNIAVAPKPFDVDNLTVRDARNIYAQLKEFFNDMK